jgi:multiple sugar transport system substrate-binding protein
MKNKLFKLLSLFVLLSTILAACGEAGTPTKQAPAVEAPPAGTKAKVTIFVGLGTGTDPDQIAMQDALAEKFNASHPNIEIEFLIVPTETAIERLLAMLSGGSAPQLVGPMGVDGFAQFYDYWADVSPFIAADNFDMSDFYGPAVELITYPDKVITLPLGIYPSFIFYNKDEFDAAGVAYPSHDYNDKTWTMAALRETAMKLTLDKNGKNATDPDFDPANIVQYGFDDSWINLRGQLAIWDAPDVGRPTSADYKTATVNSPEWVEGLQWINDGIWKDHFIADVSGQQANETMTGDPFGGKAVAMFYSHTWFMSEGLVDLPFEYDFAPIPFNNKGTRVARVHADGFAISKNAQNQQEAWEVLKWLTSAENVVDVCRIYGCLPARKSVEATNRAAMTELYPNTDLDVVFNAINYLDVPQHESYVPEYGKIEDALENAHSLIYSGENKDAKAVLDQANAEVQKILDDYWAKQ